MKRLWIAVGLLLTVTGVCLGSLFWQMRALTHLETELTRAVDAVENEAEDAKEQVLKFKEHCLSVADTMTFLSRHVDGYPLKESATLLPSLLQADDRNHFYAEAARCQFYIRELRRAEIPLFGNIF